MEFTSTMTNRDGSTITLHCFTTINAAMRVRQEYYLDQLDIGQDNAYWQECLDRLNAEIEYIQKALGDEAWKFGIS